MFHKKVFCLETAGEKEVETGKDNDTGKKQGLWRRPI